MGFGWSVLRSCRFTSGKGSVPIVYEASCAPGNFSGG